MTVMLKKKSIELFPKKRKRQIFLFLKKRDIFFWKYNGKSTPYFIWWKRFCIICQAPVINICSVDPLVQRFRGRWPTAMNGGAKLLT